MSALLPSRSAVQIGSRACRQGTIRPFKAGKASARTRVWRRHAADDNSVAPPPAPFVLEFPEDKEDIRDVFSFAGPLPERVNGRLAMLGFAGIALSEMSSHTPVLEQWSNNWVLAVFYMLLISLGSLMPKFASGFPLKELVDTATRENLDGPGVQQVLKYFDNSLELWTGRVAMIGIVGLVVAELIKQDSFF